MEEWRKKRDETWERMFDVFSKRGAGRFWTRAPGKRTVQACFWELKSDRVKNVQFFTVKETND